MVGFMSVPNISGVVVLRAGLTDRWLEGTAAQIDIQIDAVLMMIHNMYEMFMFTLAPAGAMI